MQIIGMENDFFLKMPISKRRFLPNLQKKRFYIPEEEIGISCSGGADSSLLLYILMKYHKEKIHV